MEKFKIIKFPRISDNKGTLVPFEFSDIPFEVKRVYLVTGKNEVIRGKHAHIIENELFVAVSGSILIKVNDGTGDTEILLDSPNEGLLVKKDCWHELHNFTENTIVMAFSSTKYLPGKQNYITNKDLFIKSCQ
jgi:dTDP-4-dehydrorhamnose 3,5-epimerase-like enzyme